MVLTLDDTTVTGTSVTDNGTIKVDATKTLKLNGVALDGGAITNLSTIEITGSGSITNDALANNQLTVDSGQTLTLNGTTVTGGAITGNGTINVAFRARCWTLNGVALDGITQRRHRRDIRLGHHQRRACQQSTNGGQWPGADAERHHSDGRHCYRQRHHRHYR